MFSLSVIPNIPKHNLAEAMQQNFARSRHMISRDPSTEVNQIPGISVDWPVARPPTLPNFVVLQQEMYKISAVKNL